ncbi:hypothetical protein WJ92_19395 [Burkholderia ubonensis]|nr:hypothetical protein WJ92_19395 [Burkholderia ubonensis]
MTGIVVYGQTAVVDVADQILPLPAAVTDRLTEQALRENLRCQLVKPCFEGGQQRHAVLLPQAIPVIGQHFAFGQRLLRQRLDLVQRLEELECLCDAGTRLVLLALERVRKQPPRVREASEVSRCLDRAPSRPAVRHQRACVVSKEGARMFATASRLILEQHDRLLANRIDELLPWNVVPLLPATARTTPVH